MNEQLRFITMREAPHKKDSFGYPYEAADGASTGNARTAWGNLSAPLIDMAKRSAGLLMFRRRKDQLQVFLVHPGGPYWKNKDAGAWSIPKGEHGEKEDPFDAAKREFEDGVAPEVRPPAGIF